MANNKLKIEELQKSFDRVYHGPNDLQREYDILQEAEQLNMAVDIYRRLYDLRNEEHINPYPKSKNWQQMPRDWGKWVYDLPVQKKLALLRKGAVKLVQSGVAITVVVALGRYIIEADTRVKQRHYQAWQVINSALTQRAIGGRIDALEDLNKDNVSLQDLEAPNANLQNINLRNANLEGANLSHANLRGADLRNTILWKANLGLANLQSVNLQGANLCNTNFRKAIHLTIDQVKGAMYWDKAYYDPTFRKQLGLPDEDPKPCSDDLR